MKAGIEKRLAINTATIKRETEIMKAQDELRAEFHAGKIDYREYQNRAYYYCNGRSIRQTARDIVNQLTMWNALLNGQKVYFNGSTGIDVHPFEVVEIISASEVRLREMKAEADKNAAPYSNKWNIKPNPLGEEIVVTIRETRYGTSIHMKGSKWYEFVISYEPKYYYSYEF